MRVSLAAAAAAAAESPEKTLGVQPVKPHAACSSTEGVLRELQQTPSSNSSNSNSSSSSSSSSATRLVPLPPRGSPAPLPAALLQREQQLRAYISSLGSSAAAAAATQEAWIDFSLPPLPPADTPEYMKRHSRAEAAQISKTSETQRRLLLRAPSTPGASGAFLRTPRGPPLRTAQGGGAPLRTPRGAPPHHKSGGGPPLRTPHGSPSGSPARGPTKSPGRCPSRSPARGPSRGPPGGPPGAPLLPGAVFVSRATLLQRCRVEETNVRDIEGRTVMVQQQLWQQMLQSAAERQVLQHCCCVGAPQTAEFVRGTEKRRIQNALRRIKEHLEVRHMSNKRCCCCCCCNCCCCCCCSCCYCNAAAAVMLLLLLL